MGPAHPAKFSMPVLDTMQSIIEKRRPRRVLDPFAGTGRVHWLNPQLQTVGVELEPEWVTKPGSVIGNALELPFATDTFDCLVTSPCYGSRMSDHYNARDSSKRHTYRHSLGRPLHPDNSGAMQWGEPYRSMHAAAWTEAVRVLQPDALVLLNVSNHMRKGREQLVAEWHLSWWLAHQFKLVQAIPVSTRRQRQGANRLLRVDHEWVFVLHGQLPESTTTK